MSSSAKDLQAVYAKSSSSSSSSAAAAAAVVIAADDNDDAEVAGRATADTTV